MSARRRIGEGVGKEMVHDGVGFRGGEFCLALPCSSKRPPFTFTRALGGEEAAVTAPPVRRTAEHHRLHRGRLLLEERRSMVSLTVMAGESMHLAWKGGRCLSVGAVSPSLHRSHVSAHLIPHASACLLPRLIDCHSGQVSCG